MDRRLAGIDAKLARAQELLDGIDEDLDAWAEGGKAWEFRADVNESKRRYLVSMRRQKPLPLVIALRGSEAVHHARSSLDHLACYLVEVSGGQVTDTTAWPVKRFSGSWEEKVALPWNEGKGPLGGASREALAFVRSKQPFAGAGCTRGDDSLLDLHKLWNIDKHRILPLVAEFPNPSGTWRELFEVHPEVEPVEFRWLTRTRWDPEQETKLAFLRFPPDGPMPRVKLQGRLPIRLVIGEGKGGPRGALQDGIDAVRQIVAEAKAKFPPSEKPV